MIFFQVKLMVKTSAGKQTVESNYNTEYHLCDNQWHKVKVSVITGVITLQVDNQPSESANFSGEIISGTTAPVFIGGLPGESYAPFS